MANLRKLPDMYTTWLESSMGELGVRHAFKSRTLSLKSVFKSQIKFSNHKSSAKSVCFQITYAKFTRDGPLVYGIGSREIVP